MTTAILALALTRMGHPSATHADLARARLLAATIQLAACRHGVDPVLLASIAANESNFDKARVGKLGERGRFQILPATARQLGYLGSDEALAQDPLNADYAAAWLAHVKAVCARHGHTSEAAFVNAYRGAGCRRSPGKAWPSAYARRIVGLAEMARGMAVADAARLCGQSCEDDGRHRDACSEPCARAPHTKTVAWHACSKHLTQRKD